MAYEVRELFWERALFDGTLHDAWMNRLEMGLDGSECVMSLVDPRSDKDITYELRFRSVPLFSQRSLLGMQGPWDLQVFYTSSDQGGLEPQERSYSGIGDPWAYNKWPTFFYANQVPAEEQRRMGMDEHYPDHHAVRIDAEEWTIDIVFRELYVTRLEWLDDKAELAARRQKQEEEEAEARRVLAPLIQDVQDAGFPQVGSFADIVDPRFDHTPLLPLLLDHVKRDYPLPYKAGIVWLLGTKKALFAWDDLLGLYKASGSDRDGWFAGYLVHVLVLMADEGHAPALVELMEDKDNRRWLWLTCKTIMRYVPEAPRLFEKWLDDPDQSFVWEARGCLYRHRIWSAKQARRA
ncbi:MAG: hypothetical protein FWE94_02520 [Coriobacteriia bacterium]|nr:hypothetical protein [Coriobacteriia bacterium]